MVDRDTASTRLDVTALVEGVLARGLTSGATDLHFEPVNNGLLVRARVDGHLIDFDQWPSEVATNIVARLKVLASLLTYRMDIPQEGSFLWRNGSTPTVQDSIDLRVATFPTIRGERVVVRVFRGTPQLQSLDCLGLAKDQTATIRSAIAQPAGLVVVSGPAGSGKTTTLYAMIRELRERFPERSIITLEDPVEQRIDRVAQIQINPHGELSYERCMRSILRQDPQIVMLGEVRDRSTASTAIEAALTGHLILTTVHSGDPAGTIVRFLEMEIPPYQLTSALTLVCAQRLLRKTCGVCRKANRKDCGTCLGTGYSGRTAVAQIVQFNEDTRALVLRGAQASIVRAELQKQGPDLMARAEALVASGVTDEDEKNRVMGVAP